MAIIEELFVLEGLGGPAAVGVGGALVLLPRALPLIGRVLRPVAKEVIKACQAAGDLVAEARSELEQENVANAARRPSEAIGCVSTETGAAASEVYPGFSGATGDIVGEPHFESGPGSAANAARCPSEPTGDAISEACATDSEAYTGLSGTGKGVGEARSELEQGKAASRSSEQTGRAGGSKRKRQKRRSTSETVGDEQLDGLDYR